MSAEARDRDLFIVDNSVSGWTGLRYLEEWSGLAALLDDLRVIGVIEVEVPGQLLGLSALT